MPYRPSRSTKLGVWILILLGGLALISRSVKGASTGPDFRPIYPLISVGLLAGSIYLGTGLVQNYEKLTTQDIILGPVAILGGLAMSGIFGLVAFRDLIDYDRARSIVKNRITGLESMVR